VTAMKKNRKKKFKKEKKIRKKIKRKKSLWWVYRETENWKTKGRRRKKTERITRTRRNNSAYRGKKRL